MDRGGGGGGGGQKGRWDGVREGEEETERWSEIEEEWEKWIEGGEEGI